MLWSGVDLDLGVLRLASNLIRITGGMVRKRTKPRRADRAASGVVRDLAGQAACGRRRRGSACLWQGDGTFRDPRTVTRWLVEARERHSFEAWMTFHACRKTTATVLDEAGLRHA